MKRIAIVILLLAAFAAVLGWRASRGSAAQALDTEFRSAALGEALHFKVYLPSGYEDRTKRYPVVYFLHGLPSSSTGYRGFDFAAGALARAGRPAILVVPQADRDDEPDPEYLDRGPGHGWETAIATELPRVVDARFRTIADRRGRALVGVSAGGYGAMLLGLHHLRSFAVLESWSGYFHPTDPTGMSPLDLGSPSRNARASAHTLVPVLRGRLARTPTLVAFYVGRADHFLYENLQLDRELSKANVPHVFRIYPGGHDRSLWVGHAPDWLGLAVTHLAAPRRA